MAAREYRPQTLDERVAVLESELAELTRLLRQHMAREEATTATVMRSLACIEKRMSKWHGIALGVALAVSAFWSLLLAGVAWMK